MHLLNRDSDALLSKVITGCREAQKFAKPLIDKTKYEKGVKFEQKLAALMNIASDRSRCAAVRSELENLDDLVFQMKYVCMEPMLKMIEEVESNLNKYLISLPSGAVVDAASGLTVEGADRPDVAKYDIQKDENSFTIEEPLTDHDSFDGFGEDSFSDDNFSAGTSEVVDPFDVSNTENDPFTQFDAIIEESSQEESTQQSGGEDELYKDLGRRVSIPDALNSSQATIDGLLYALEGSEDTLDLLQATLEQNEEDVIKNQATYDSEADAAQEVFDSTEEVYVELKGSPQKGKDDDDKATDLDTNTDADTDADSLTIDIIIDESAEVADATARQSALLDGHQGKFFDRLHHLFEVHKKVEGKMKKIDPKEKLKEITVIAHSEGIREVDGSYKSQYQQQDVNGKVARNLGEVYAAAKQAQSCFMDLVYQACDKVKDLGQFDVHFPPLKPHDRASEKAKSDYSHRFPGPSETWLYDVLRASITCKTAKQMESINKFLSKKTHIVQAKNRFATPAYNGYRDLLYHVRVPYEFKDDVYFIAEIQVKLKEVIALQNFFGLNAHLLFFRPCFSGPERSMKKTLTSLQKLEKAGKVDQALLNSLLISEDTDQLAMLAQLFHEKLECLDEALELYARILTLEKCSVGEKHAKTGTTYKNIGLVQGKKGDFDSAMMNLEKALEIQEAVYGSYHPEVATTRSHLGHVICLRGDETGTMQHQGALRQHRNSLAIREETLGADHVDVATSYQNIGLSLGQLGDLGGSVAAYREALRILQNVLGPSHPDVAATHSMIGTVLCGQGEFDKAMKEFTRALDIRVGVLGKNHPTTADSHTEIGNMLCETGDYDKAEWRHREALRIRRAVLGKDHPDCATSISNIGYVLSQRGDYEGALAEHRQALGIRDAILGKRHPDSLASRRSIKAALIREPEL
jgi:tetratricopeptide (TPR) repeat protein